MVRARDADREQVIAALDDAYADGQLSGADRELRVNRALEARTLGDLSGLTRDLQVTTPVASTSATPNRTWAFTAAAAVVGLAMVGGIASVVLGTDGSGEDSGAQAPSITRVEEVPPPVVQEEPVAEEPAVPTHRPLSTGALREFFEAYESRFHTSEIFDASFYADGRVMFSTWFGPQHKNRLQDWNWTPIEGFERSGTPTANTGDLPFPIREVDLKALMKTAQHARKYLGVEHPEQRIDFSRSEPFEPDPTVSVHVSNRFNESGHLTSSTSGEIQHTHPYDPDNQR